MAKNQKNTLAESLIESLVEDVKALEQDSSFNFEQLTRESQNSGEYLIKSEDYDSQVESELVPDKTRVSPFSMQSEKSVSVKSHLPEGLDDKTLAIPQKADLSKLVQSASAKKVNPPKGFGNPLDHDDKTVPSNPNLQNNKNKFSQYQATPERANQSQYESESDQEKTIAVATKATKVKPKKKVEDDYESNFERTVVRQAFIPSNATEAALHQADHLKIAQQRILELEQEVDKYRAENEEYSSAGEVLKNKLDEFNAKLSQKNKQAKEKEEALQSEINILKSSLVFKDKELDKIKSKNDELEIRVKHDLKKVRIRERELENRLELAKIEKAALVKSKDETILELKRKIDHLDGEVESYREKCLEFNRKVEFNQEQFKRTVKALRLALSNLETNDEVEEILKKVD